MIYNGLTSLTTPNVLCYIHKNELRAKGPPNQITGLMQNTLCIFTLLEKINLNSLNIYILSD